jgi:formyl-CoA transferase
VANNVQWEAFVDAIGREDLKEDPRFQNQEGRFKNSDTIERIVLDWLQNLTVDEALKRLREKRVACDSVIEIADILNDPQLKERGMIRELYHPMSGKTGIKTAGFPVHFTESGAGLTEAAPYPGQHNVEIYKGLLGISEEELLTLRDEEII